MTRIITHLSQISDAYDALFVDLWGCVHNGIVPFDDAISALQSYKQGGGTVVLLTNSPRPRAQVEAQLGQIGVARDAWDTIASSGDSARAAMFDGVVGEKVYFIGDGITDEGFFEPLNIQDKPVKIQRVPLAEAEGIVCTGPFDTLADPDVNRPDFLYAKQKGLKLLCANPDIVVDRGESREWCAGALAALYTEMGGESLYFGKPHPPIYDLAYRRLSTLGKPVAESRILCIGDGLGTDILGATGENLDSLFITGGLAASETNTDDHPDPNALKQVIEKAQLSPTFAIGKLR